MTEHTEELAAETLMSAEMQPDAPITTPSLEADETIYIQIMDEVTAEPVT